MYTRYSSIQSVASFSGSVLSLHGRHCASRVLVTSPAFSSTLRCLVTPGEGHTRQKPLGDLIDTGIAVLQSSENRPPGRVRERGEGSVEGVRHSIPTG